MRGFRKALEPRLKKAGLLRPKAKQRIHLFFSDSHNGWVSTSPSAIALVEGGVRRLRLPAEAPSRSALKVEEALIRFFGSADALHARTAVDLGPRRGAGAGSWPGGAFVCRRWITARWIPVCWMNTRYSMCPATPLPGARAARWIWWCAMWWTSPPVPCSKWKNGYPGLGQCRTV